MEKPFEICGRKVMVRGLTWGEKKALKAEGYNIAEIDPGRDNDDLVEAVLSTVLGHDFLDQIADAQALDVYRLFLQIHRLTFVLEDEAKN